MKEKAKSFRHVSLAENAAAYRELIDPLLKTRSVAPEAETKTIPAPDTSKWRAAFAASERTLFKLDRRRCALTVLNHAAFADSPDGVRITSSGHDPALTLPPVMFSNGFHVVRLEITSPSEDELQLFYQTERSPGYAENRSVKALLYKGRNEVYLLLDALGVSGTLRLDPGTGPGEFILHELEVRGI
jgi:hypothetical protein